MSARYGLAHGTKHSLRIDVLRLPTLQRWEAANGEGVVEVPKVLRIPCSLIWCGYCQTDTAVRGQEHWIKPQTGCDNCGRPWKVE